MIENCDLEIQVKVVTPEHAQLEVNLSVPYGSFNLYNKIVLENLMKRAAEYAIQEYGWGIDADL